MKVLIIDEWFPWPLDSGKKIRTYNLVARLASRFEILFLAYADLPQEQEKLEAMVKTGVRVFPVEDRRLPKWTPRFYAAVLRNFLSRKPFSTEYHIQENFISKLRRVVYSERPDLVHCEWTNLAPFLDHASDLPQVIAAHNVESDIWKRLAKNAANPCMRLLGTSQARKIEGLERYWYPRVDRCIAVSREDQAVIEGYGATVDLVENGVDLDYYDVPSCPEGETLIFTASFDTFSNQDGAEYLLREIFPRIRYEHPEAQLLLVGKSPPAKLIDLGRKTPGVTVTGTVPDVRDYIARSTVCIVPLRIGGGSRLKILEALAMRKAVVSTTMGAEGIGAVEGRDLLHADTPETFAASVSRCLKDRQLCARLGEAGRALVSARYGWEALAEKQTRVWCETVSMANQGLGRDKSRRSSCPETDRKNKAKSSADIIVGA